MSIRLRLTLWYAAVMAVTLVGGSLVLYLVLSLNELRQAQDQLLASKGNGLAGSFVLRANRDAVNPPTPTPNGQPRRSLLPQYLNTLAEGDISIVVRDGAGNIGERSSNLGEAELPLDATALAAAERGESSYQDVTLEGVSLRLYTVPAVAGGQIINIVQVARPTRQVDETLASLRSALLTGDTVLILLGALVGWFLAGRSLQPIRRITGTARSIQSSGQLDRRVFYQGPRDELGELAIAINDMLLRLESAFISQRRFVADASHELRTPLTTLRVNIEVLRRQRQDAPPDWGEVLDDLAQEAERMSRLVEGLLDLARADAGQHLDRVPLALDPLLERVERQTAQLRPGVAVHLEGEPVGQVVGNADALVQLLLILIDNAVKYTPPGGAVQLERQRSNGFLELRVRDSGPGIAPPDLPRIFDRFYRSPTSRGRTGTGLGLPIARWIAEEHRGRLTVETDPSHGTTFTIWLPAIPPGTGVPPPPTNGTSDLPPTRERTEALSSQR
jgi:two-component system, OmpR family, sensor kinase